MGGATLLRPICKDVLRPEVLVQAWKKSATYIRRYNWVDDPLLLDASAFNLEQLVHEWSALDLRHESFKPHPIRLVPAPKSARWRLSKDAGWRPVETCSFRPLALVSVRDQVLATSMMMCLADRAETALGHPDDGGKASEPSRAVAYGNRLFCDIDGEERRFRWGNTDTYRRYYTDYRAFIRRARSACDALSSNGKRWAEVRLDLAGFYDRIRTTDLRRAVTAVVPVAEDEFVEALCRLFAWRWDRCDVPLVKALARGGTKVDATRPVALPQGLVAAGFFSNLVLRDFDDAVSSLCARSAELGSLRCIDYARYVDDMRIVVEVAASADAVRHTLDPLLEALRRELEVHAPGQEFNEGKMAIAFSDDLGGRVPVSTTLQTIQSVVSGPFDVTAGTQALDVLDGLLAAPSTVKATPTSTKNGASKEEQRPALLELVAADPDVRDDSTARFSVYRWRRIYRTIRVLAPTSRARGMAVSAISREELDQRAGVLLKRMIERWIEDPSLIRVLAVAIEISPDAALAKAVCEMLTDAAASEDTDVRLAASYALYELFRTVARMSDERRKTAPSRTVRGLRKAVAPFAAKLALAPSTAWYVAQQALLLIAVSEHELLEMVPSPAEIRNYIVLHAVASGRAAPSQLASSLHVAALAWQLRRGGRQNTLRCVLDLLAKRPREEGRGVLAKLIVEVPPIARAIRRRLPERQFGEVWDQYGMSPRRADELPRRGARLADVARETSLFQQEWAAIDLFVGLIHALRRRHRDTIAPSDVRLTLKPRETWSSDRSVPARATFKVRVKSRAAKRTDPRVAVPTWCRGDVRASVQAAQLVRAAILGRADFTQGSRRKSRTNFYRGLDPCLYRRRHGFFTGRAGLGRDWLAVSPWLERRLAAVLAWPGSGAADGIEIDPQALVAHLDERRDKLFSNRAQLSRMPTYDVTVEPLTGKLSDRLRVALVQTARPTHRTIKTDPTMSLPQNRARHERHLRAVLSGVLTMLDVRRTYASSPSLDLVLLPEMSVHPDDVEGVLLPFARRLRCTVFCGLSIQPHPTQKGSFINTGIWIVPMRGRRGLVFARYAQGKAYPTANEKALKVVSFRPCQWILEFPADGTTWKVTGAICYDATDLALAADMRNRTDMFVVAALNKDVATFDAMASALHYHMFQHVVVVNTGQYGGTSALAPFKESYERTVIQHHGNRQVAISFLDVPLDMYDGKRPLKTRPAGVTRRPPR